MSRDMALTPSPDITIRHATLADRDTLEDLKERSIAKLLDPDLTPGQRRTIRRITPFDPTLVEDMTYYVATVDGRIAASGGWSRRRALFRDQTPMEETDALLDPASEAAGIRGMYTDPGFARRGLGGLILSTALAAAGIAGFKRAQLLATSAGARLYRARGWIAEDWVKVGPEGWEPVPGALMTRAI